MQISPFLLERYFARYEFSARYLLSSSDCDGLPMEELLSWADDETRGLWAGLRLGYTESQGHPLLLREIAGLYSGIEPAEVIEFVPEEAIFAAMNCLVGPGDHVVVAYPAYQSLYQIAESSQAEVDHWLPREQDGWRFDPEDLAELVRPSTKLIVVNFPHNPTGAMPSREEFLRVVEIARGAGAYLFCDEMYRFLEQDAGDRLPSAPEVYEKAVALFGMSKTYGLAGLRLGWLVTRDEDLRRRLQAYKDWLTICGSAPSEILAIIGLRNHERIVSRHLARIRRNLDALDGFSAAHGDVFTWTRPRAGSIGLARLVGDEPASQFALRAVREADIMLAPSPVFGYGERHFRIGFGRENLPEALESFDAFLRRGR
jgi:aspartate/methionine/tyrosine aminotransferase